MVVGFRGDGEAVRDQYALGGELAVHLADRSVFASNDRDVVDADIGEKANEA
jgi:hypothetical protein